MSDKPPHDEPSDDELREAAQALGALLTPLGILVSVARAHNVGLDTVQTLLNGMWTRYDLVHDENGDDDG